jgi:hypothetical protein
MAMDVSVDKFDGDDIYQAGAVQSWVWRDMVDNGHFWSFVVIPVTANVDSCEITRFWYSTDNDHRIFTNFTIRVAHGGFPGNCVMNFKALRAPAV